MEERGKSCCKSAALAKSNESKSSTDEQILDPDWTEKPTHDAVKDAWNLFVEAQRKADRISLVASLTMCEVKLEGNTVRFEVKTLFKRSS